MTNEAKALIGIGIATLAIIFGMMFLIGKGGPTNTNTPADPKLLIRPDSHQTAKDAKVTLVEFGDFQCPGCAAAQPTVKQIKNDYKDKVNVVFRNYPLPSHANAMAAATAAEAAASQGKFWEMHDKLYENQTEWSEEKDPSQKFAGYAQEIGLDIAKFKEDVTSNKFEEKIKTDEVNGNMLGVNSTPTFYLDGQKLEGIPSFEGLKILIDQRLTS